MTGAIELCSVVGVENALQFSEDELKVRWAFQNYVFETSSAVPWRHYGTMISLPTMRLPAHTHLRIQATLFIVDMPNQDDSGVMVRLAKNQFTGSGYRSDAQRLEDAERFIYQAHVPFSTGVSTIGLGKADNWVTIDLYVDWEYSTASIDFEIWSPDIAEVDKAGNHRFTVTTFIASACTFPGQQAAVARDSNTPL